MRRCLHAFLVGVLVLSLSMDAARACWFLRRGCRPVAPAWSTCGTPPLRCADHAGAEPWGAPPGESDACGAWDGSPTGSVISGSVVSDVVVWHEGTSFVEDPVVVHGDVVSADVAEPVPPVEAGTATAAVAAQDAAAEPPAASVVVPDLKPAADAAAAVQPASAVEEPPEPPAPEPVPPVEPMAEESPVAKDATVTEPVADAVPVEPNLFEEADRTEELDAAPADAGPDSAVPADEPREPMPEPAEGPVPPAAAPDDEPAAPPSNPLDEAERRSGEAARLWVDATGRHSVVGVLVDVRADGRCVIDTGAGILEVRASDLRRRDRDYAAQAAERLATRSGPGLEETAGR